jgi:hypothetical protein
MKDSFECSMNIWDQYNSCAMPEKSWEIESDVSAGLTVQSDQQLQQEQELKRAEQLQAEEYTTVIEITEQQLAGSYSDELWQKSRYLGVSRCALAENESVIRR